MFKVHTEQTAPEASRPILQKVRSNYGMVPNLHGVLAGSPGALEAYVALSQALGNTGLSPAEQQVVLLAVSVENGCTYCVAAHSTVAKGGKLFDDATLKALREGQALPDARLEALRSFTTTVVRERGFAGDAAVSEFLAAGFTPAHILGVVTGVALKTLSNYTNHIAATPLDEAFAGQKWEQAVGSRE